MALDQQQYRQDCQSCSLLGGVIEESVWKKVPIPYYKLAELGY